MTRSGDSSTRGDDPAIEMPTGYEFAGFTIDLRRVGVWRGDEAVPLEPKSFDVLRYLIEHRERLVTRDELLDAVWPGTFVTPNALTRAVARLRKALGDTSGDGTIVQTVSKRGYRFVAPVAPAAPRPLLSREPPADGDPRRPRRMGRPALALAGLLVAALGALAWWAWPRRGATDPVGTAPLSVAALTASGNVIHASIAPGGETIAYVDSAGGLQGLLLRQTDGANPIPLVAPAPVEYWGVTIAPDSRSIYRGPRPMAGRSTSPTTTGSGACSGTARPVSESRARATPRTSR